MTLGSGAGSLLKNAPVAQLAERQTVSLVVAGSTPAGRSMRSTCPRAAEKPVGRLNRH